MLTVSRSEQKQSGLPRVQVSSEVSRPANAACFGSDANFSINAEVSGSQADLLSPPRSTETNQRRRGRGGGGGGRRTMAPVSDVEVSSVSDRGGRGRKGGPLSLDDCLCPVCLEIFLEPVTLPCTHTFCKGCFLESVDKATLCCPMCRKRVSTWARLNSRSNTLVNEQLWRQIQTTFPLQCQRRLSGQDAVTEDDPGVSVCIPRVSEPGELRKEYQDQITKLTEEKRVLDEEERKASEEYIQRLLAEEEELLQEESRRREDDERLARTLNHELNSSFISQENVRPADVTPAKKKEKISVGQIEKFLCPLPSKTSSDCSSASSFMANKENILLSQVKQQAERPPLPKLDYYGAQTLGSRPDDCDRETESEEPPCLSASVEEQHLCRSHLIGDGGASSAKRKSSEEEEEEMVTKRGCRSLPSTSSSLEAGGSALLWIDEREPELLSRRQQQEEEDRRLALLLQKKLDQEERQRVTNRSKGSADAYLLRQSRRGKAKASSTQTPGRPPKTTKTSTSSSCSSSPSSASSVKTLKASSPSSRGSKQATLTEMFSSLSS